MSSTARSIPVISAADAAQFISAERSHHATPLLTIAEKLLDMGAVTTGLYVAEALYRVIQPERAVLYSPSTLFLFAFAFGLLFVFLLERHGGYRPCVSLLAIRETERTLRVTLQTFALGLVGMYLLHVPLSHLAFGIALITVPFFLTVEKWEAHNMLRTLRAKGYGTRRAIILGTGAAARRLYTALLRSPKFGVEPVAFVGEGARDEPAEIYECSYWREHSAQVVPGPLCPELFRQLNASVLVVADSAMDRESMLLTAAKGSESGVMTYFAPGDFLEPGYWMNYAELDGIMLTHLSRESRRVIYDAGKRALDLIGGLIGLLFFAPLLALVAILVKSTSSGPVFFRQQRVGKGGQLFSMYKFRSMYSNVPNYGYSPTAGKDPRVTPLGRFLRRTSLDEIPQLINVVLGQMSLVGPRPEMPFIVEQYTSLQRQRLAVKPGITGLWQISADRAFLIHENLEYDLYYVRHRSLFMDAAILLHTFLLAARGV